MKYQIELPDEIKDSHGQVYEPTGEHRRPRTGEYFLVNHVQRDPSEADEWAAKRAINDDHAIARPILRPKWTWPSWLGGWGIAKDERGSAYWYEKPASCGKSQWSNTGTYQPVTQLQLLAPTFTPPVISDWTKPVLNPNWKA